MCEKKYVQLIEQYRDDMIKDLQTLVCIKSVDELGIHGEPPFSEGVQKVLQEALAIGRREGFETFDADGYGGHIEWKAEPCDGKDPEIMAILGHLDVVPEGSGWEVDPYSGEVKDGRIYGRGTSDNKGPLVAALYAMKAVKEAGYVPKKTIRMILGLDEETNWDGMEKYLEIAGMPDFGFTPDGSFPVTHGEKGVLMFDIAAKFPKTAGGAKGVQLRSIQGGTAANSVPDFVKALVFCEDGYDEIRQRVADFSREKDGRITCKGRGKSLEISVAGVAAHGAMPWKGVNAIAILMEFLGQLQFANDGVGDFIDFYNKYIGYETNGSSIGCGFTDEVSGDLIWNTGMIDMTEEAAKLTINIRYPISCTDEQVYGGMMPLINRYGYGIVKGSHNAPIYLPVDHPVVESLMAAYQEFTGDMDSKPMVIGGASYARAIPNAVCFGMLFPGEVDIMHQKNESVDLASMERATKIFAESIVRLTDAYVPEEK